MLNGLIGGYFIQLGGDQTGSKCGGDVRVIITGGKIGFLSVVRGCVLAFSVLFVRILFLRNNDNNSNTTLSSLSPTTL